MRLFLVNFAGLTAIAFFQIHCDAGDAVLKDKIVRATLNHNQPALVKVGTSGVTSLEFPYKIEAIDGYGFSQTPGSADAFQISYTKGTNYFSVRALKSGVTGNLTVVLDQKVYSFFFEESSEPSFVDIFGTASDGELAVPVEREAADKSKVDAPVPQNDLAADNDVGPAMKVGTESKPHGLTFSEPPENYLPTAITMGPAGLGPEPLPRQRQETDQPLNPAPSPVKHPGPKKAPKKSDPKPEKSAKESVAKTQKPFTKRLFGWL
jgi:hypothetical protein